MDSAPAQGHCRPQRVHGILKAGGQLMTDSRPLNTNLFPSGTRVVASDSAKHAHYAPAIAEAGNSSGEPIP